MLLIDINCDMGEGIGNEIRLMPFISSANIACGYHAGDENEMKRVVDLCLQYGVAIGAHPSFKDKANFGRTVMHLPTGEIHDIITDQLFMLNKIVTGAGGKLHHVKPHGALYNMASTDEVLARTIATAIKEFDDDVIYYGLAGSVMIQEAKMAGLKTANEVFADRTYQAEGTLTPRSVNNALIMDTDEAMHQVLQMILERKVKTLNGAVIPIKADTICIHGDGAMADEFARAINNGLREAGVFIKAL